MFILKRENVQIVNVQRPEQDQKIPILKYNNQTFRLIKVYPAEQREEAMNFWRDLTDNKHKFCVLLEEQERYSLWLKVKVSSEIQEITSNLKIIPLIQICLFLLQTTYLDIQDLFGKKQGDHFIQNITQFFQSGNFPEINSQQAVENLLEINPLQELALPPWEEHHLIVILKELNRISQEFFGDTTLTENIQEIIQDFPLDQQEFFITWLKNNSLDKLWKSN